MKIEELLEKIQRLDDVALMSLMPGTSLPHGNKYSEDWLQRTKRYKVNLVKQFREESCKKYRKALEFYMRYSNDSRNFGLITTKIEEALNGRSL